MCFDASSHTSSLLILETVKNFDNVFREIGECWNVNVFVFKWPSPPLIWTAFQSGELLRVFVHVSGEPSKRGRGSFSFSSPSRRHIWADADRTLNLLKKETHPRSIGLFRLYKYGGSSLKRVANSWGPGVLNHFPVTISSYIEYSSNISALLKLSIRFLNSASP